MTFCLLYTYVDDVSVNAIVCSVYSDVIKALDEYLWK